jgi:glutamate N-acetyltransferase/amino-acid N-acetyltransferase
MASRLGCDSGQVLMASTGVIGEPLDVPVLAAQFDDLANGTAGWHDAARAIMTTDTFAKGACASVMINGVQVRIAGIAKGSGMIAPDMATMLGFIATDAAVPHHVLADLLAGATQRSFNAITVDSDSSTNDSVMLIATGAASHQPVSSADDPRLDDFRAGLDEVMQDLAQQIVRDGEGASKFITISVSGAADDNMARLIGMSIANSPLVKTAIAGEDANWGRIVMAVGKAGAGLDQSRIGVAIGGIRIAADGARVEGYDEAPVASHMQGDMIDIEVSVGSGVGAARVWTCDLTHGYITINADYRS